VHRQVRPARQQQLTGWFYPALAGVRADSGDALARGLLRFLDAPGQAIVETPASLVVSFDSGRFNAAVQKAVTGGLRPPVRRLSQTAEHS
jgi:hypothetical protein